MTDKSPLTMIKDSHLICVGQRNKITEGGESFFHHGSLLNTFSITNKPDGWDLVCVQHTAACLFQDRQVGLVEQRWQEGGRKKNRDKQRLPNLDNGD